MKILWWDAVGPVGSKMVRVSAGFHLCWCQNGPVHTSRSPPEIAHHVASQFADTVRNATITEAELRLSHIADEVRRVSSQNARDYAIAEAEIRHQQVAQSMSQASAEHAQNLSSRIATQWQMRNKTWAEAESRHNEILKETCRKGSFTDH